MKARTIGLCLMSVQFMACPEERQVEEERRVRTLAHVMAEGRGELAKNKPDRAVVFFKEAVTMAPNDTEPLIQLAEAYRQSGNENGAILTLKQAEDIAGGNDPSLKRARADMHVKLHQAKAAIAEFVALRDMDILTDDELQMVALLLAHNGQINEAYKTIEPILKRSPDDPATKTVEAEILLIDNKEVEAARLMDRLIQENPELTAARVLRARYFAINSQLEAAETDLMAIPRADQSRIEVVTLRSRVLNQLGRVEEAAKLVEPMLEEDPRNPVLLAILAETRLLQERGADSKVLIDRALGENAKFAPALYVRGKSAEQGGNVNAAITDYETAVRSDPTFAPPLSRLWQLYVRRKETGEAMSTLERLLFMGEATQQERVELAKLYVSTGTDLQRAKMIMVEALRRDPKNAEYTKLKAKIDRALTPAKRQTGIIIMRHR
jgi:tetratricopeptide (TPR) repeat protein